MSLDAEEEILKWKNCDEKLVAVNPWHFSRQYPDRDFTMVDSEQESLDKFSFSWRGFLGISKYCKLYVRSSFFRHVVGLSATNLNDPSILEISQSFPYLKNLDIYFDEDGIEISNFGFLAPKLYFLTLRIRSIENASLSFLHQDVSNFCINLRRLDIHFIPYYAHSSPSILYLFDLLLVFLRYYLLVLRI